jgi:RNA 2',3'-cyclic 3'-phosphodiesterase
MVEAPIKMFVGIQVPSDVADSFRSFRDAHFEDLNGVQWISTSNLHVTLRFLGPQTMQSANLLAEGLANISSSPIGITLDDGGIFEDVGVLFVSILPVPELMELQASVDQVALVNGVPPAQYPYTPHISIARLNETLIEHRSPRMIFHQAALQLGQFCQRPPIHCFRSSEMSLFTSVGGRYRVLRTFRLEGHSASGKMS